MVLQGVSITSVLDERMIIQSRGIVATTALETDKSILNDVDTTDTVVMADLVQELEELQAVCSLLLVLSHDLDGNAPFEVDRELVGLVGSILGVNGAPFQAHVRAGIM